MRMTLMLQQGDNVCQSYDNATISANDVSVSANSFVNSHPRGDGNINADTLTLSVAGDFDYATDYLGNGNIDATNQNFIVRNGDFTNNTSIVLVGNLEITANNFINTGGSITADSLILSIAGDFDYADNYLNNGNIDATTLNFRIGGDFSYYDVSNSFVWDSTDKLVAGTVSIEAFSFDNSGSITTDSLALSVAEDFDYGSEFLGNGNINAANQNFIVRNGDFTNNTSIALVGNLEITANNFINTSGSIAADSFTLSVAEDFDYVGNIDATILNFQVGGDFSYNDASNDFVWNIDDSLVVLGSASFNVDGFYNRGRIDVADNFNLTAADDFYNWYGATINADNFNVLTGDRFYNLHSAEITTNNFNLVTGGLFANRYSANINANNLNVTGDNFYNTDNATISANDVSVSANSFVNSHPRGDGNITTDTLTLSLIGDFNYASDFGNINATSLNFQVGGDFSYNDVSNSFVWDSTDKLVAGTVSIEAFSFDNAGSITTDSLALSVAGGF